MGCLPYLAHVKVGPEAPFSVLPTYIKIRPNKHQSLAFKAKNIGIFQDSLLDPIFLKEFQSICNWRSRIRE